MKKRHKGYFKKPGYILEPHVREYIKMKKRHSKNGKFRVGLWVNIWLRDKIK